MKVKIYQPYFKDENIPGLDPACVHLDLRDQTPEEALLREHTINMRCRELALADGADAWGMVSWKFRNKVREITAIDFSVDNILQVMQSNPNHDVYFFDVYPRVMNVAFNVWEHGQWYHPHMLEICQELFPAIGLDVNLLYFPMGPGISCYANYYMGNARFWNGWLELIERYLAALPTLSTRVQELHNGPSDYGPFPNLWYFPFIHERLFSTYILKNCLDFKIYATHLGDIGDCAIMLSRVYDNGQLDVDIATDFLVCRKNIPPFIELGKPDLATDWLNNIILKGT
jgi:hypothetical protein